MDLYRLPRPIRARAKALPPDQLKALADHVSSRPDSVLKAFGPASLAEIAVDVAESKIDAAFRAKHAAIRAAKMGPHELEDAAVDHAQAVYESEFSAAKSAAAAVVGAIRDKAQAVIDRDLSERQAVDEARTKRITDSIRVAFKLGRPELERTLATMGAVPANEVRLALAQVANEARLDGVQAHQEDAADTLGAAYAMLEPAEVRGARALVAQLDALRPEFEPDEPAPRSF